MKTLYTCLLLLFCSLLSAQEICDNGIDDDGDGDIDLLDADCICSSSIGSITADFEENTCCPTSPTSSDPDDGYFCVNEEWDFHSIEGNTDYYNTDCGYIADPDSNVVAPLPIPSGSGAIGLFTITSPSLPYTEGIARCLDCTLISGQQYDVTFYAGFNAGNSSSPVEFAIYGKPDCSDIPTSSANCFEENGWTELGTFTAAGTAGEWVEVNGSFTAPFDITALAFGKSCGWLTAVSVASVEYHFVDALEITGPLVGTDCGSKPQVVGTNLSGNCVEGYVLDATPDDAVQYQWYLDGIAIAGATSNPWNIDPAVAGEYQVLATFANGECAISAPLAFDPETAVLTIDGLVTEPSCFGETTGSVALLLDSLNSPVDIQWNTGSGDPLFAGLGTGTYSVTITDANGCFGTADFTLGEPTPISVELSIQQPTGSMTGEASVLSTGGTPPYQYSWSNGAGGQTVTDLSAGSYELTVTDSSGCTEVVTFEIQESLVADVTVVPENCVGDCDGAIEVLASGGVVPYTYNWDILDDGDTQEGLCAGVYQLTLTDDLGTTFTAAVVVEAGVSIDLSIQALGVRCSETDLTDLDLTIAGGQPPFNVVWSTGVLAEDLFDVGTGDYQVTVTDANGCESTQHYTVEPYSPRVVDFATNPTDCDWEAFQLALAAPLPDDLTYFLNEEEVALGPSGTLDGLVPGSYRFSYEDANGCTEEIGLFNLVAGPPYELFVDESTRTVEYGEEVELEILVSPASQLLLDNEIIWSTLNTFDCIGLTQEECTQIQLNPTESEIVRLRFRDENGCEQVFSIPIRVEIPDYIYVPNAFSPNNDGINDEFAIFVTDFVRAFRGIQVFSRWGGLVYENNDTQIGNQQYWDGSFQGQPVDPGVFVYTISLELVTGEVILLSGDVTVVR